MSQSTRKTLTIATVNSLFDGIEMNDRSFQSWMWMHMKTFIGIHNTVQREQQARKGKHPVELMIEKYQPDIIVVNEVIKAPWGSETVNQFEKHGYKSSSTGYSYNRNNDLKRVTMLASKIKGEPCEVPVNNFPGGRFCGLGIGDRKLTVIAAQGSPFHTSVRKRQLRNAFKYAHQQVKEGNDVIIAGDFNDELTDPKKDNIPNELKHLTKETFPCPEFDRAINDLGKPRSTWARRFMELHKGARCLDHIFVPGRARVNYFERLETTSDHHALVAEVEI